MSLLIMVQAQSALAAPPAQDGAAIESASAGGDGSANPGGASQADSVPGSTVGNGMIQSVAEPSNTLNGSRGQDEIPVRPPYKIGAGFLEQFNASLDDGGRFGASHAYVTGSASFELAPTLDLSVGAALEYSHYRFTGNGPFDPKPWSDIITVGLAPRFTWTIDEHWAATMGPVMQYSGELGADFEDSWQWGGLAALRYAFERDKVVGLGLLVLTQLQDDPLFLPMPLLDWHFGDGWRLSNIRGPEADPFAGVELIKELDRSWEIAGGAGFVTRRFRLDNTGPAPGGVGNESGVPLFARFTLRPASAFRIDLVAGISLLCRVELLDSQGTRISVADADPAPLLGLFGSIRF